MNEKDRWGAISAAAIDLHCALKAEREAAIEVERLDKLLIQARNQLSTEGQNARAALRRLVELETWCTRIARGPRAGEKKQ